MQKYNIDVMETFYTLNNCDIDLVSMCHEGMAQNIHDG